MCLPSENILESTCTYFLTSTSSVLCLKLSAPESRAKQAMYNMENQYSVYVRGCGKGGEGDGIEEEREEKKGKG